MTDDRGNKGCLDSTLLLVIGYFIFTIWWINKGHWFVHNVSFIGDFIEDSRSYTWNTSHRVIGAYLHIWIMCIPIALLALIYAISTSSNKERSQGIVFFLFFPVFMLLMFLGLFAARLIVGTVFTVLFSVGYILILVQVLLVVIGIVLFLLKKVGVIDFRNKEDEIEL